MLGFKKPKVSKMSTGGGDNPSVMGLIALPALIFMSILSLAVGWPAGVSVLFITSAVVVGAFTFLNTSSSGTSYMAAKTDKDGLAGKGQQKTSKLETSQEAETKRDNPVVEQIIKDKKGGVERESERQR